MHDVLFTDFAPTKDYPARIKPPSTHVPAFKPPPGGRLREIKVTYRPSAIPVNKGSAVTCPYDAWKAFRNLAYETVEVFRVAFLDFHYRLLAFEDVARGTVGRCRVHPREVFHSAVQLRASAVILMHCHPDGELGASRQDIDITRRLRDAGKVLDILLLDHLIVGPTDFYSMRDHRWK